jgi:hypothetical protein
VVLSATNAATTLGIDGAVTLTGNGKVTLSLSTHNAIVAIGSGALLDNLNNTIAGGGTICGDASLRSEGE